jgi:transmembrane sensor
MDVTLLFKKMWGELSSEEEKEFNEWLASSPKYADYYYRFVHNFEGHEPYKTLDKATLDHYRQEFQNYMQDSHQKERQMTVNRTLHHRRLYIYSAAACIAAIFVASIFFFKAGEKVSTEKVVAQVMHITPNTVLPPSAMKMVKKSVNSKVHLITASGKVVNVLSLMSLQQTLGLNIDSMQNCLSYAKINAKNIGRQHTKVSKEKFNELIVDRGASFSVILSDGTKVWLNSETKLYYPTTFSGDTRRVILQGEAYFQVAKDKKRDFLVETADMEIRDYGTQFNVNTRHKNCIRTTLVEGNVSVRANGTPKEIMLKPGHSAELNAYSHNIEVTDKDVMLYVGWKDDIYYFENTKLSDLFEELSRWYDVNISIDGNNVKDEQFTGCLSRRMSLLQMLSTLSKTSYISFKVEGKNVKVEQSIEN